MELHFLGQVRAGPLEAESPQPDLHQAAALLQGPALSTDMTRDSNFHGQLHDDNVGPNARFKLVTTMKSGKTVAALAPDPSRKSRSPIEEEYGLIVPNYLIAATHNEIRIGADALLQEGEYFGRLLVGAMGEIGTSRRRKNGLNTSVGYRPLAQYLANELQEALGNGSLLSRVRFQLTEQVRPMSLHLGLVRIGNQYPMVDILYDTTEGNEKPIPFAHVAFSQAASALMKDIADFEPVGIPIQAY